MLVDVGKIAGVKHVLIVHVTLRSDTSWPDLDLNSRWRTDPLRFSCRASAASSIDPGCSCAWQSAHNCESADPWTGKAALRSDVWHRSPPPSRPPRGRDWP